MLKLKTILIATAASVTATLAIALAAGPAMAGPLDDAVAACRAAVVAQAPNVASSLSIDNISGGGRVTKVLLVGRSDAGARQRFQCVAGSNGAVKNLASLDAPAGTASGSAAQ